jgi:hypothetical protein
MLYIDNSANTLQSDRLLLQLAPTKFEMDLHDTSMFKKQDLMIQRLKMLIKAGADVKQQPDSNGVHQDKFQAQPLLYNAITNGLPFDFIVALIESGADVNYGIFTEYLKENMLTYAVNHP